MKRLILIIIACAVILAASVNTNPAQHLEPVEIDSCSLCLGDSCECE